MSINDHENPTTEQPNFDLDWAFDDAGDPTHITVFSDKKSEITTHWITIEKEYAWDFRTTA
jgi:hypothetical protein